MKETEKTDTGVAMVAEFHQAFGLPGPAGPVLPGLDPWDRMQLADAANELHKLAKDLKFRATCAAACGRAGLQNALVRLQLGAEEHAEVGMALAEDDPAHVLHELADVAYVADGHWVAFGMGHLKLPAMRLVHAANMAKLDKNGQPLVDGSGRVQKPPGWKPAQVGALLDR